METADKTNKKWALYYQHQKEVWYDPDIPIYVKGIVRLVELHRSDSKGWSISVRKIAALLGISSNTALKYLDKSLKLGLIECSPTRQRKRRKLRLSVSLRAPVEFETPSSSNLSHWEEQSVSPTNTQSVSHSGTVNNKEISKANNNKSLLKKEKEKSFPYKEEGKKQIPTVSSTRGIESMREVLEKRGLIRKGV